jgi:hypothetical protein
MQAFLHPSIKQVHVQLQNEIGAPQMPAPHLFLQTLAYLQNILSLLLMVLGLS